MKRRASKTPCSAGTIRFAITLALALGGVTGVAAQDLEPGEPVPPTAQTAPIDNNLGIAPVNPSPVEPSLGLPETALDPLVRSFAPATTESAVPPGLDLDRPDVVTVPRLILSARLTDDGQPIESGLAWRVYGAETGPDGHLPLVASGAGGDATFELKPGVYFVYCGFGHAGTTVRVELHGGLREEAVVLNAGGLKLRAAADDSSTLLPAEDIRFDVLSMETDDQGERKIVAQDVKPDEIVRLAADTYHVVSRYGTVNAQTRGDVEVKPGKLTEVTLYQRAAEVTLKLVGAPGGEAIADTKWSVLTPGGDIVTEGVGAFPSFVLASGEYTVVARHAEKVYQRNFAVETGRDTEVEVLALD
jgi:hypothetical protein